MRDDHPDQGVPTGYLSPEEQNRIALAIQCRDCDGIPKVDRAGEIASGTSGSFQIMHNGLRVLTDSHYGSYNREVIRLLRGHHEPQEEYVFDNVVRRIQPGGVILELGSFWSYYSLWFLAVVEQSKAILVEPLEGALEAGRRNFELNGREGTFVRAAIGGVVEAEAPIELWPGMVTDVRQINVDSLLEEYGLSSLSLLHADIQGAEVRMLLGAAQALAERRIQWLFISTHGENLHQRCLQILRKAGYHIVCSHTPDESYSVDGLIVASVSASHRIRVSRRRSLTSVKAKLRAAIRVNLLEPFGLKTRTQ